MKLNRLEAHDRYEHFIQDQSQNIFVGAEECLKKNPLSLAIQEKCPYVYIFAHPRTADDGVTKVMYWAPRISIPKAQTNSYLFRAVSNSDLIEVVWMLPPREMWGQYKKENVTASEIVEWSIHQFQYKRDELEKPHPDDISEEKGKLIMQGIVNEKLQEVRAKKINRVILGDS